MEQTLLTVVLCFLLSILKTSWADSNFIEVSKLPQFPLKSDVNNTNFKKLPEIRVFRVCQHAESAGSQVRFNCYGRPLNESKNYVEIYRKSADAELGVICSAPYPVTISTNIIAKKISQSYNVSKDGSVWTHEVKIFTPSSGFISCSSLTDPKVTSTEVKVYIDPRSRDECLHCGTFVPVENKELIHMGESESGNKRYLASCRLNSWFVNGSVVHPELYYGKKPINFTAWDPVKGFFFTLPDDDGDDADKEKEDNNSWFAIMATDTPKKTLNCKMGNRFLNFTIPRNVTHIPRVEIHGNHMRIQSDWLEIHEGRLLDISHFQTNLYFCRWASSCPLKLQLSRSNSNSSASPHLCSQQADVTEIEYELKTDFLEAELAQGIVKYGVKRTLPPSESDDGMKYFTGLDNNIYTVPGAYSNKSVIQLVEFPRLFYKNETTNYTFTCRTIDFVIAPRVYLVVGMQNDLSTRIYTNGRTLSDDRLNRISEYNFQLDLDVNMGKVECHGMDPYSKGGQWRSSNGSITIKYTRAPFLKPGHDAVGHERCVVGGNCTLECPIVGEPMPTEFFWLKPRGNETKFEISLKLVNLEVSDSGYYICFAKNAYGNETYTYTVSVEDPFMDPWTKAAIATIGTLLTLLATVFAWKYYTAQKCIGDFTEAQVTKILNGNPEAAEAATDGEEKAKQAEFTNFIRPELLEIYTDNILGKGNFGVVYRGIYENKPAAVKGCNRYMSSEQIYDFLMEIKLMGYIGHHPHIVTFYGADISRLRSGELYIVMELSEHGSLESYLRNTLYLRYSKLQQSEQFPSELDKLLKSLLGFCLDVISAMAYLESKNIIHGDLGTRNVLLFEGNVAKLADFGYSRKLYDRIYQKQDLTQLTLPYRWASVELLNFGTFSTASDVWAFGVTVWEIFELGQMPFRDTPYSVKFREAIQEGLRLSQPQLASDELYDVLMCCWDENPDQRPSFRKLHEQFVHLQNTMTHKDVKAFTTRKYVRALRTNQDLEASTANENPNEAQAQGYEHAPPPYVQAAVLPENLDVPPSPVKVTVPTDNSNYAQLTNVCATVVYTPLYTPTYTPVYTPFDTPVPVE